MNKHEMHLIVRRLWVLYDQSKRHENFETFNCICGVIDCVLMRTCHCIFSTKLRAKESQTRWVVHVRKKQWKYWRWGVFKRKKEEKSKLKSPSINCCVRENTTSHIENTCSNCVHHQKTVRIFGQINANFHGKNANPCTWLRIKRGLFN